MEINRFINCILSAMIILFLLSSECIYSQNWVEVKKREVKKPVSADSITIKYELNPGAVNGKYEIRLRVISKEGYFSEITKSTAAKPLVIEKYLKGMPLELTWARDEPGEDFKEIEDSDYQFEISYHLVKELKTVAMINLKNHTEDKVYLDYETVTGNIVTEGIDTADFDKIQLIAPNGEKRNFGNGTFSIPVSNIIKAAKSDSGSVDLIVMFEDFEKDRKTIYFKKRVISVVSLSGSLRNPSLTLKDTLAAKADFFLYYTSSYKVTPLLEYSVNANEKWVAVVPDSSNEQTVKFSLDDAGFKEQDNVTVRIYDPSDPTVSGHKVFPVYLHKEPGSINWGWLSVAAVVAVGVGIFVLQPPKEEDKPYASPPGRPNN